MTVSRVPNVEGGIQPTIVTAKGDLITAVANANPARLGVGSDGQLLTADSTSATGLSYQNNFASGKNKIINGDFRINQRSFSTTSTTSAFGFDRFFLQYVQASGTAPVYSAQTFTPGTAPVVGYEGINFARLVTTNQNSSGDYSLLGQRIEDVRTLAGQTVTVSLWAKASSGTPKIGIGAQQQFGSGGSGAVSNFALETKTLSTSWARYTSTFTVPSVSGKTIGTGSFLELYLMTSVGTDVSPYGYPAVGLQNATIDIWGVQVEAGSTATAFQTATGTIQGELAACQRYYYRLDTDQLYSNFAWGFAYATTAYKGTVALPVTMRIPPSAIDYSTLKLHNVNTAVTAGLTASITSTEQNKYLPTVTVTVTSGLTTGGFYYLGANNSTAGYLGFSAEL